MRLFNPEKSSMQSRPLVHVNLKFGHHGHNSGYDVLSSFFPYAKVLSLNRSRERIKHLERFKDEKPGMYLYNYSFKMLRLLFNFQVRRSLQENSIVHYLYPENTLAFTPFNFPRTTSIVSTFHQPEEWFDGLSKTGSGRKMMDNFRKSQVAIGLGSNQIPVLTKIFSSENVEFIPHGVDTEYFSPSFVEKEARNILILGSWLRDFDMAAKVVAAFKSIDDKVKFTVISSPENERYFRNCDNVLFKKNISDFELLAEIQKSDLLFLPLNGAIANNALLECMSCGLPTVITKLDSIRDYVTEKEAIFVNKNVDDSINALEFLLKNETIRKEKSTAARAKALSFDWHVIAEKTKNVYQKLD